MKHYCGQCGKEFNAESTYSGHVCESTGYKPIDPRHLGKKFLVQSKKALERGDSLTAKREKEIDKQIESM